LEHARERWADGWFFAAGCPDEERNRFVVTQGPRLAPGLTAPSGGAMSMRRSRDGLYLMMISAHGLIRGEELELGRDADTGGQTRYVVELARALAGQKSVERVDLVTRQIFDPKVSTDYAEPQERIAEKASIIRIPFGPRRYLRKEVLWPYLDSFVDMILQHVRRVGRVPDVVHGHYADAGYAGARLAALLGVPFVFTAHSLGRVKRAELIAQGATNDEIEARYNISRRIEAEETALDSAAFAVTSTEQEIVEQYASYENYSPRRMFVIPPGVDLSRFHPSAPVVVDPPIVSELARFLRDPHKPMILVMARADERKNIATLVRAYAGNEELRRTANLVAVMGNRDDIRSMEKGPQGVLTDLLLSIDRHDLYGSVAYPRHHRPDDVPELYRIAARSFGVFVNPALVEPFGLTIIEAAASGLPVVATEHGGPPEIIKKCRSGVVIDPLDEDKMGRVLLDVLRDKDAWRKWSKNGARLAHRHYSWEGHASTYLSALKKAAKKGAKPVSVQWRSRLPMVDRVLISDLDGTLLGDRDGLRELLGMLDARRRQIAFGVATGRSIESTETALSEWEVPIPDVLVTSVGSEIHYGSRHVADLAWSDHIDFAWHPDALIRAMGKVEGLRRQPKDAQRQHKISYFYEPTRAPPIRELKRMLRERDLRANLIFSHQRYLDLLPIRASKGLAVRYLALKWGLPLSRFMVAGDSGNDAEMLTGDTLAVVVGEGSDLESLRGWPKIYFTTRPNAWGIIDGIARYDFLNTLTVPEEMMSEERMPA
jgi:sucrose-phosphate synthase